MTTGKFLLSCWDWNPLVAAACVITFYLYGLVCRWKFQRKAFFFFAGLILCFLALASPLSLLARGTLFSAHMLQHLLLVLIIPPLLLLGLPAFGDHIHIPGGLLPWGSHPLITWFSGVGAMWIWHFPALCDAAASKGSVHALQTISLLFMGALFWRPIVGPRMEERISPLIGILYLFSACIACSLLGIWISFAPVGVCPVFMKPMDPLGLLPMVRGDWGLTPAVDQQIGGLLMWVPACLVYLGAILALLGRFYRHPNGVVPSRSKEMGEKHA
ncbi:MAG TPA: cytochrome c oxidase assembly protein [bacterium]|jgi:putative membrane protein|nr:cytochrome c oxidase assembly protein [bacterium]